jgi:hypothetical protein
MAGLRRHHQGILVPKLIPYIALSMLLPLAVFACRRSGVSNSPGNGGRERATAPYEAYFSANGPFCGKDGRGVDVECEPLDNCVSEQERRCEPSDGPYQAYFGANGPYCGKDSRRLDVECHPRDACVDPEKSLCRPQ